ncbi:MAG: type II toxin-antitoxin system VapC family toxin [Candidatus Hydrogenedentes bacterium]|nr:type II toxin-antitoxin system VapC family toxin [Candidatus Hydrogenedentota bacterium]
MADFVLDCSAAMACWLHDGSPEAVEAVEAALSSGLAVVPALWPFEVASVLRSAERRRNLRPEKSQRILLEISACDVHVEPAPSVLDLQSQLMFARRLHITTYDAAYLEIALRKSIPLATLDRRLAEAARYEGVQLLIEGL